ncbi:MAG: cysteine-rich CWC family protein [Curvibacter sp.]|jgi:hypothetical protein|nr:cysteine-rich CWC family protein [Curvibacter sp.]
MHTAPIFVDASRCPLCHQPNACAQEIARATGQAQAPCWCASQTFSWELLARVPPAARDLACICEVCARGSRA